MRLASRAQGSFIGVDGAEHTTGDIWGHVLMNAMALTPGNHEFEALGELAAAAQIGGPEAVSNLRIAFKALHSAALGRLLPAVGAFLGAAFAIDLNWQASVIV